METRIKAALIALHDGIMAADGDAVLAATCQLDTLRAETNGRVHPQLTHFLERRSYSKALQWLGGGDVQPGVCGGGGRRS